ncbi:MAG: hypothetical protein FJ388_08545, partial [Verrucomicrobia bacterium]|nr:hypothetical protein [Verrucomicrobiota bacterium]
MKRREWIQRMALLGTGCMLGAKGSRIACAQAPTVAATSFTHDLFEQYERHFAEARLRMPERNPAVPADRKVIARVAKDCLGIRDEWVPKIRAEKVREAAFDGGRIELLRSTSWPGVTGTALLYLPAETTERPSPLVILCCGHGTGGKLGGGYQRMARHLTRRGAMVLCPDNLGQGERAAMGHSDCVKPFACGTSVQALIVMETLGWVAWAL